MSRVQLDRIWQPEKVLPYLLISLKAKIETVSSVKAMYLFGSRSRTPVSEWQSLEGKDWDVYVVCDFPIVNTQRWGSDLGYHLDIVIITQERMEIILERNSTIQQLFPKDEVGVCQRYIEEIKEMRS